ncbi:unnamed protein product, partial [Discosporangium mesarthrocarpum]
IYRRCLGNTAGYMDRVKPYARQAVEACQWIHQLGLVWGDVKPENFVEGQDGELKAIDFESVCVLPGGAAAREGTFTGSVGACIQAHHALTPRYCAPERARASLAGDSFPATKSSDIWSLGMVLYWLFTGQDYFEEGTPDNEIINALVASGLEVSMACLDPKQEQARNLLSTMLHPSSEKRGTLDGVLSRAFFAGGASVTMAQMQAHMASSLGSMETRLGASIREDGESTRTMLTATMEKLEAHVDGITEKIKRLNGMLDALVQGQADCPLLFTITPEESKKVTWKPETWFSEAVRLKFLCAYDLAPAGDGFLIASPTRYVEKWAPAMQASAFCIQMACKATCAAVGVSPAAVDGMVKAIGVNLLAGREVSAALKSAAGQAFGGGTGDSGHLDIEQGMGEPSKTKSVGDTENEMGRQMTGEAYEALMEYLEEHHQGWRSQLKAYMTRIPDESGKVSWVCLAHTSVWERNKTTS